MPRYGAVAFDLLTALLDSGSLWSAVAGSTAMGTRWRAESLRLVSTAGDYRPYERLVAKAAMSVGLSDQHAARLCARWGELAPWPDVRPTLEPIEVPRAIVTNCSEAMAQLAARTVGIAFDVIVSAERAGGYKPDPRPYGLALSELGRAASEVLFVAGSAHDVGGAGRSGMDVYWANRAAATAPGPERPLVERPDLGGLLQLIG